MQTIDFDDEIDEIEVRLPKTTSRVVKWITVMTFMEAI